MTIHHNSNWDGEWVARATNVWNVEALLEVNCPKGAMQNVEQCFLARQLISVVQALLVWSGGWPAVGVSFRGRLRGLYSSHTKRHMQRAHLRH